MSKAIEAGLLPESFYMALRLSAVSIVAL